MLRAMCSSPKCMNPDVTSRYHPPGWVMKIPSDPCQAIG